jgi:16S rRNA A1518/A1519 N6-dimethyltransferase RsmA/KsgA/DIM1 with predicted DNA glycosylase/AP lyase activity
MERNSLIIPFWKEQPANSESMYLRSNVFELEKEEQKELISYLPDLQGKRVLELASGIGRLTRYFSVRAQDLISVELMPNFL